MAPPIEIGNASEIASVGIAIYATVTAHRSRREREFLDSLIAHSDVTPEQLAQLIAEQDELSEIFERGLEAAMKTSAESKRRLLGRVAAAAIDGSGFAKPDRYLLLIRSIDAIEPAHVQMLVILVSPQPRDADGLTGSGDEGWLTGEDIAARWEDVGDVAQVLTAVLDREGLIKIRPDLGHSGDHEKYAATEHGRLLLKHLTSEELGTTDLREAVLVPRMWYHSRGDPGYPLIVQNLGPGHARRVRVQVLHKGVVAIRGDVSPFHLDPLEEKQFWLDFGFRKWDYQVLLDWRDDRGDQHFEAILKSDVTIQVGAGSHA